MKRTLHFVIPAFGGLLSCFPISAQMRVRAPSANLSRVQPSQPAHVRTIMTSPNNWAIQSASGTQSCCSQVTVVHVVPTEHPPSGNWRFANAGNDERENEVPGLGFDFPHLAAIRGSFPFNPAIQLDRNRVNNDSFGPIFFIENPDFRGVPGLGFDFPHLAAIRGNLHLNPAFEHTGLGTNDNSFVPIFWSENPGSSDFVDPSVIQQVQQEFQQQGQQQPQVIIIQQPTPVAREQLTGRVPQALPNSAAPSTATSLESPAAAPPIRDVGEFIFVRREGRILYASAFFVSEGVLQFVTPEGIRRRVPVAELDTEATRKMNETLGSTVDLNK
jgi:hypothetical protein